MASKYQSNRLNQPHLRFDPVGRICDDGRVVSYAQLSSMTLVP